MNDIELIIKIDKAYYDTIKDMVDIGLGTGDTAIANGIPLSKRHGKIGDLDKLIKAMKARNDDNGGEPLNAVDRGYDLAYQHMIEEAKECVIIEADKER